MNEKLMLFFTCIQLLNLCFMYTQDYLHTGLFQNKEYAKFFKLYCFVFIPTLVNISLFIRPFNSFE